MALAYLMVVLLGSARQGRVVGLVLSVACFLAFNFFLLPPYYTFVLHDPLNWWVLVAFLITGAVAAELFHRAQRALEESESRARVLDRLAAVGAESLAVPRAVDAVRSIARVVLSDLAVGSCRIIVHEPAGLEAVELARGDGPMEPLDPQLVEIAVREHRMVGARPDGSLHLALPGTVLPRLLEPISELVTLVIPLRVRERVVGVLVLGDPDGLELDAERARFADALVHYAALAVERVRLTVESEHVEALREADRVKDAVLASVSHDLRTPLTTIRALGSELRAGGDERAALIEEEADRLNRLVGDLLDLSRIRGGALPLEPQIIAAEDLVGAVLQRLGGFPGAERIHVRLPPGGALPVGRFDFVQALRALANLLENALQHSPGDRAVDLDVGEEGDELVFRVLDRGEGVPEADRERIFQPFVRGPSGSDSRRGGAGLGLAIARTVAEAQGGSVRYSPRAGGGAVFELRLPAEAMQEMS
jgi:two-component system, OmpR family, sensor histidine kinase KdpD